MKQTSRAFAARLLVSLLTVGAVSLACAADPRASQFYEDALQRYEKNDFKGAAVQLRNALKADRNMLPVHVLLGKVLLANGEANAAEAAFNEALRLGANATEVILPLAEAVTAQGNPDQLLSQARFAHAGLPQATKVKMILLKATAASDLGNYKESLRLLGEVRALEAGNSDSWSAEVPIRVRAGQLVEAKAAAEKAVALDPKSSKAAYQLATVAHVGGDLNKALEGYTRTLALKADHVDALVARAGIYVDLNRMDAAAADVAAARKSDARDPRSIYLAALVAEKNGKPAEVKQAMVEVTNIIDSFPIAYLRYRPQALMLGGLTHFSLDQYEKAKPLLEAVLRQTPTSPVAKLLARIYLRDKQVDQAVDVLDVYLKAHPNDPQARMLLASSQMSLGRYGRASQLMQDGLKSGDDPQMRAMLGMSLVEAGKFEAGAAELEATIKKDPGQIQAAISLANLYIASGSGNRAAQIAADLVKRQPNNAGFFNLLGSALATKGDRTGARAAFEQSLKLDAAYPDPQLNLVRLDIAERKQDAAQKRLNALLAKNPKDMEAMLETANLFSSLGQADESLRWLVKANDSSGNSVRPGLQIVDFHLARGRPDQARDQINQLLAKAPGNLPVVLAQARVQLAGKQVTEARTTLSRLSNGISSDAAALTQIAELQMQASDPAGAAHALDKALAAKPQHFKARALRSTVYLVQGDSQKAEQLARSVVASDPKAALGHVLLGDVAKIRNQNTAAIESYRRAWTIEPNSTSLLALFNTLSTSQPAAASALAQDWVKKNPQDLRVWRALGDSQARAGSFAGAKLAYEQILRLNPQDAETMNNLAMVLIGLKDNAALGVAEQALKLSPDNANVIGTAGWAAFHASKPDLALQRLRDARLRNPNNPETRYFLAHVLVKLGRSKEAKEELAAALQSGEFASAKDARDLYKTLN